MNNSDAATIKMNIGVELSTQIVDASGACTHSIQTGVALRAQAANLGIISFEVLVSTAVSGNAVTDRQNSREWTLTLLLPAACGPKTEDRGDTELVVIERNKRVSFTTIGKLISLPCDSRLPGYYESKPFVIIASTS